MTKEALKLALEALVMNNAEWKHLADSGDSGYWSAEDQNHYKQTEQAITAVQRVLANEALEKMAENARELGLDYEPAQPFITHNVEQPYDWSEWVCPDPKNYLMKCCDCGLVHEAEFGVVRYKSETERDDCDMVNDPILQAVFRMRRSEEWTPEDTAHRSGGLPMAQPEQEPVGKFAKFTDGIWREVTDGSAGVLLYTTPQRKPLTDEEIQHLLMPVRIFGDGYYLRIARAIEAAHGIKGEA